MFTHVFIYTRIDVHEKRNKFYTFSTTRQQVVLLPPLTVNVHVVIELKVGMGCKDAKMAQSP